MHINDLEWRKFREITTGAGGYGMSSFETKCRPKKIYCNVNYTRDAFGKGILKNLYSIRFTNQKPRT